MTAHRKVAVVGVAGVAALLFTTVAAGPAGAHGALENPVSRTAACGSEGRQNARPEACRAAIAASGAQAFGEWDEVRVANVRGRDRELIPDGKLCSGGLDEFRGFDLARADWPATRLSTGAELTFTYRATIPHKGTFRLYVTRDGYDPSRPLGWSDLQSEPFLRVADPALENGSYTIEGRLPRGKTGRHLIYTVWQNSDTPDTYYSCSDVVFASADSADSGSGAADPGDATSGTPADQPVAGADSSDVGSSDSVSPAGGETRAGSGILPLAAGGAAMLATAVVAVAVIRRRRP